MNTKQKLVIAMLIVIGIVLALLILRLEAPSITDEYSETGEEKTEVAKGPHGGRLFTEDSYGVEISIFEQSVTPEFRIYTYKDGKPLDPVASKITITLDRLGRKPQEFAFVKENDYLKGNAEVEEPYSFEVTVAAQYDNKSYHFTYEQIEARVSMTDQQVKQNNIELLTAGPARIKSVLQLIGEIRFNKDRLVHVVPRLAGIVESAAANAGDRVRKGQLLAVISSQALADQRSELLAAQKRLTLTRTTFAREKRLWEDKISAEQDYLQARNAMQEAEIVVQTAQQKLASLGGGLTIGGNLTRYEIRSPIDGTVIEKHLSLGEALTSNANIFIIADLSTVWAEMTIYAKDMNTVKVGQKATVKATAFESQSSGTVFYVGSLVGEQTRTAKARIVLPNPQGIWRPGLPVNINLVSDEVDVPVAVSLESIQTFNNRTVVFGRYGSNFEARPIEPGRSDGRFTEVIKGLNAGELYAAKNSFLIKAELGKADADLDD